MVASAHQLRQHRFSHDDKPNYTCKVWGGRFNTWGKYNLHRRKHLGKDGNIMCEHCGRKFISKVALKDHLFQHTGKREFVCSICGNSYSARLSLHRHLDSHTGKKYHCDVCGMEFTQAGSVRRHKATAHGVTMPPSKTKQKKLLD